MAKTKRKTPENRQKTGKATSTSFKPGKSGNPGGRPKLPPEIVELRALAREHTKPAVEAIIAVMKNKKAPAGARVTAAAEILDRGWGRAAQTVEANVTHNHGHESVSATVEWIEGLLRIGPDSAAKKPVPD